MTQSLSSARRVNWIQSLHILCSRPSSAVLLQMISEVYSCMAAKTQAANSMLRINVHMAGNTLAMQMRTDLEPFSLLSLVTAADTLQLGQNRAHTGVVHR